MLSKAANNADETSTTPTINTEHSIFVLIAQRMRPESGKYRPNPKNFVKFTVSESHTYPSGISRWRETADLLSSSSSFIAPLRHPTYIHSYTYKNTISPI